MLYLLDTANLAQIKKAFAIYPLKGVTTNPTLVSKEQTDFMPLMKEIRQIIGIDQDLHIQVSSLENEEMVKEAQYLVDALDPNIYVKVPITKEGLIAIRELHKRGVKTTATAVFTGQQALLAARAGADFVAPYINRLNKMGGNGIALVREIVTLFEQYELTTKVLGASFGCSEQIQETALAKAHAITLSPALLEALLLHPATEQGVQKFKEDWEKIYGKRKIYEL
jgi:fructose-6-phosphate aldolase 2